MIKKFSRVLMGVSLISALVGCGAGGSTTVTVNSITSTTQSCTVSVNGVCTFDIVYSSTNNSQLIFTPTQLASPLKLTTTPVPCETPVSTPRKCTIAISSTGGATTQTLKISLAGENTTITITGQ